MVQWYTYARRVQRSADEKAKVSRQLRATLFRIARLPSTIGSELERLGCGRHKFAFVAWGDGPADIESRFEIVRRLAQCSASRAAASRLRSDFAPLP